MGGFAFLVLLVAYGVALIWYALNVERGTGGYAGLLAIKRGPSDENGDDVTAVTEASPEAPRPPPSQPGQ